MLWVSAPEGLRPTPDASGTSGIPDAGGSPTRSIGEPGAAWGPPLIGAGAGRVAVAVMPGAGAVTGPPLVGDSTSAP